MIGIVSAAFEVRNHKWIQATDEVVLQHLTDELRRHDEAATSMDALGCTDPSAVRATYLAAVKAFHPSRFARRPEEIRSLANEVFLRLQLAFEKSKGEVSSNALEQTRTKIAAEKEERHARRRNASSIPAHPAKREDMRERRRNQIKDRLGGHTTQRIAQVHAATDRGASDSQSPDQQKIEFEKALKIMNDGNFEAAAAAFKAVAVARPSEKLYRLHMHYAQGRVFQGAGQIDIARAEYKRCLGLDASFVRAHEAMSSLPKEGKKKSGFISKLFGK